MIRIGISGWTYPPWRGKFYPKGLPQKAEMAFASRTFPTIEVNGTFYGLQKPATFEAWRDGTPDSFIFSIKASRYITHIHRLRDAGQPLANFFAQGLLALGGETGSDPLAIAAKLSLCTRRTGGFPSSAAA